MACHSASSDSTASQSKTAKAIKLESDAFTSSGMIPVQYTCDGAEISPPLNWNAPPQRTRSLALIVDDPDAPGGTFVHWVLYNLPADTRNLSQGIPNQPTLANIGMQGKNSFNKFGYSGPCPPSDTHRYFFKVYALDQILELESGKTKEQVLQAIEGHVLAEGELIGHYRRQR
jgi:hypothetical protein